MKNQLDFKRTKIACYLNNLSMSAVGTMSPILFVTFRELYDISYTLLGTLVLINFCTQLLIDLVFSFFSNRFNIKKTVRLMPVITAVGMIIYAVMPAVFPESAYLWLSFGTVLFSVSAGLNEVLTSPIIGAIPSDDPDRVMSKLHSVYAWGVAGFVIISTLFLKLFKTSNWSFLVIFWSLVPFLTAFLFLKAPIPEIEKGFVLNNGEKVKHCFETGLFVACIFFGGAAECTMTQWISSFIENALHIPKIFGDVFGVAFFASLLGLGRTLYSKIGKNISSVMLFCMGGAFICYLVAALSPNPISALIACSLTGLCTSMLWPGSIIWMGERVPKAGVTAFALLAAGGDLGASISPQLVGIICDVVEKSEFALNLSTKVNLSTEQIAMKSAILFSSLFALTGFILVLFMKSYFKKRALKNSIAV